MAGDAGAERTRSGEERCQHNHAREHVSGGRAHWKVGAESEEEEEEGFLEEARERASVLSVLQGL